MARKAALGIFVTCISTVALATADAATPPGVPVLTGTNPPSPANTVRVHVLGSAPPASTVSVFPTSDCSGPPYPSGSAASFASPGIEVQVPDDSKTTLSATATDASSNVSSCSAPITYVEDSRPPHTFIDRLHLNQSEGTVTPVFSSDEPRATFECRLTRWGRCLPGARTWHMRPGRRIFRVRASDPAGNVDPTPASKAVTVHRR
jgi:hypothetical protein